MGIHGLSISSSLVVFQTNPCRAYNFDVVGDYYCSSRGLECNNGRNAMPNPGNMSIPQLQRIISATNELLIPLFMSGTPWKTRSHRQWSLPPPVLVPSFR
ncbi:uncharacterized protein EI97DRAFT_89209 [Westerdykella ornata]|uniref:Uncharacterized protein n=1 Tax=Westerdykella ornata TaxID=318751 RepID=A0A6A6JE03_WESOR|nr:uncharacterized protein EI97DRAFT_89209 [Westerdykella ornata]KAF2274791.1 hypothetical protein EI97DRAFT_89209 [Westerdykella ornata]